MKSWLKVLLTILITGGIVGGVTYYIVNKNATTDKKNLQSQIDDLSKKLAATSAAITTAASTTTTNTSTSTATTDPTVGWKTYTDSSDNYTIKYPTTWTVDLQNKDSNNKAIPSFLPLGMSNSPHSKFVEIQVSQTLLPSASRVGTDAYAATNGNVVTSQSTVVVGGISTTKLVTNLDNGYDTFVYLDKGTKTYVFSFGNITSSDTSYIEAFDNMLSTFQFTK